MTYLYLGEDKGAMTSLKLGLQSVKAEDLPAVKEHPFCHLIWHHDSGKVVTRVITFELRDTIKFY